MAHYDYARKALVLMKDRRAEMAFKGALAKINIEIEKEIRNLSSVDVITKVARSVKGTGFIRSELFNFIQNHGFPYLVILDFRINIGFDASTDPGSLKILKTFLISYIVFSMGRGFDKLHLNLLLIFDNEDAELAETLEVKQQNILALLHTKNEQVNQLIAQMKQNNQLFSKIMTIYTMKREDVNSQAEPKIGSIGMAIEARKKLTDKMHSKTISAVSNSEKEPASVILHADNTYYSNGEVVENIDKRYSSSTKGDLFIEGYWTAATLRDVTNRLLNTVSTAVKELRFKLNDPLRIHLQEKCIIDGTIASTLAGIVVKELAKFSDVKVLVSKFNAPTLRESKGFNMVKEYIKFEDE